ncbi:MAG: type II toxin-antitoxin system VapC family toxin [Leptolyngbya sp. Prado105]|jgi:PIN domain nuclease of toxin-antitoxin system|nr:type II toxin-antitoxin system VapC family toxin [Leptolyngbya sp. Prado105]
MNLLLDSNVLIWLDVDPDCLSNQVQDLLIDENNVWIVSVVSVWEIQIKLQLGKLSLNLPFPELLENLRVTSDLQIIPIELADIWALEGLPNHHRDPFDRLLIAQAIVNQFPIVSADSMFDYYPIQRIW